MPRYFTRKIEIRFDDQSIEKIDNAAKAYGMSRAEFIRSTLLASSSSLTSPKASSSPGKTLLTPDGYLSLVQHVYRLLGGAINRSTAEVCVAATLQEVYNKIVNSWHYTALVSAKSSTLSHVSSIKQQPVIENLRALLTEALAVAAAIRDNAQDDQQPLPADIAESLTSIASTINEACNVPDRIAQCIASGGACSR